jgi:hypothetical protein
LEEDGFDYHKGMTSDVFEDIEIENKYWTYTGLMKMDQYFENLEMDEKQFILPLSDEKCTERKVLFPYERIPNPNYDPAKAAVGKRKLSTSEEKEKELEYAKTTLDEMDRVYAEI